MLALLLLVVATYLEPISGSKVIELSDSDFDSRIGDYEVALVMFYAPWCGHCKQLKPEFDKASDILIKLDPPVQLLKVDCTAAGKQTCTKFGVTGFPTLKIFKKGKFWLEYSGPRDRRGIVKYMAGKVGPSVKALKTQEIFDKFISHNSAVVVGFFADSSPLKSAYFETADALREKVYFGAAPVDLPEASGKDGIVLYRPKHLQNIFEPSQLRYNGFESKADIEPWVMKNLHGLVGHRMVDNQDDFKAPLVVAYFTIDYKMNVKGTNYWRNRILKVAQNFSSDFNFAMSDPEKFPDEFKVFGKKDPVETPLIGAFKDGKKYAMSEDFTVEALAVFLTKLKNGELEPTIMSEPVPEDNTGPVKVAVGKNFDDVVTNNGQDTLIEFYAPWCGHCKKLAPIWNELGERLSAEDVAIVKIDATNNDFPSIFKVEGFPTIYWLPKGNKSKPVLYDGGRNLEALVKYIAKHATSELKNFDRKGNPKKKDEL